MTDSRRWLLPEGIEEVLPPRARQIEVLRRDLLDLYHSWGYELVIPPFVEYLESLLTGVGSDLDLQTFKVTDQLTGRMMGIRADITPQVARMEAHSLKRDGVVRLSYSGSVLRTRSPNLLPSRSPLLIGAEVYGSAQLSADVEVVSLMLETLQRTGLQGLHLDLGHVGVYRAIVESAGLGADQEHELFDILQRKAVAELDDFISAEVQNKVLAEQLRVLVDLHGGIDVLDNARQKLAGVPAVVACISELEALARAVAAAHPDIDLYFDLAELRGYEYHTGVVFGAYVDGYGQSIAKGGRYDDIGRVFGRARPATGFSADLKALIQLLPEPVQTVAAILAPADSDPALEAEVKRLREQGEVVIQDLGGADTGAQANLRKLVKTDGHWTLAE